MKFIIPSVILFFLFSCNSAEKSITETKNSGVLSHQDSLAIQLIELYGSDQIARRNNRIFVGLDTINFKLLVDFVKAYGYPSEDLLGKYLYRIEQVQATAGAILLHNPHRLVNEKKYLNLFLQEVENGNMNREALALFLDKYYWVRRDENGNRKVLYGTQFGKPCLKYRKKSDSVRAIIGLKPLPDAAFMNCK